MTLNISKDESLKIDLNGHKINVYATRKATSAFIRNYGTLELLDSTSDSELKYGSGKLSFLAYSPDLQPIPGYASNLITNYSSLTIHSGQYENLSEGYAAHVVDNEACNAKKDLLNSDVVSLNIEGGLFRSNGSVTIRQYLNTNGVFDNVVNIQNADIEAYWVQDNKGSSPAKGSLTVKNVRFDNNVDIGYYGLAQNFKFVAENTVFNSRVSHIMQYNETNNLITLKDCTFNDSFYMWDSSKILGSIIFFVGRKER